LVSELVSFNISLTAGRKIRDHGQPRHDYLRWSSIFEWLKLYNLEGKDENLLASS